MEEQSFKKHAQYVTGFHVVTFAVILAAAVFAVLLIVSSGINRSTVFDVLVVAGVGLLFYYVRQFATGNQDRVIRAEENFRSFRLTGNPLDSKLTRSQVIALRFADDSEYADLSNKAISQNLSAQDIKQSIQQWRADHHRV
jgi:archaellum biogenesis protein FlaJ (TadC family)